MSRESRALAAICETWNVPPDVLLSRRRSAHLSQARAAAYFLLRTKLGYSLPQVGKVFDRHHTSILHTTRRFDVWRQREPLVRERYADALRRLSRGRQPKEMKNGND